MYDATNTIHKWLGILLQVEYCNIANHLLPFTHFWYIGAARLRFNGIEVPEHSLVVRETIGLASADTLMCESDYRPCCTDPENAWFRDFNNGILSTSTSSGNYQTRDDGVVRYHYNGGNPDGIFFCRIRVSATEIQTLYVGVYPSVNGNNGSGANGDGKPV